jgi:hypothetical protein
MTNSNAHGLTLGKLISALLAINGSAVGTIVGVDIWRWDAHENSVHIRAVPREEHDKDIDQIAKSLQRLEVAADRRADILQRIERRLIAQAQKIPEE